MESVSKRTEFANRFLSEMGIKGCTATEIAELLGITKQSVSNYTSGKAIPPIDKLHKLADYFDVTLDWLLCRPGAQRATNADMDYICRYTGLSEVAVLSLHSRLSIVRNHLTKLNLNNEKAANIYNDFRLSEKGMEMLSNFLASEDAFYIFQSMNSCIEYCSDAKELQDEAANNIPSNEKEADAFIGNVIKKSNNMIEHSRLKRFETGERMYDFVDDQVRSSFTKMGVDVNVTENIDAKINWMCGVLSTAFRDKILEGSGQVGKYNETQK